MLGLFKHQGTSPTMLGTAGAQGGNITFADLTDMPDPSLLPPLDRPRINEKRLSPEQAAWRRDGVVILRKFVPDAIVDPYIERRTQLMTEAPDHFLAGWYSPNPYEHVSELRALSLYPPLMQMMQHLIGEPMMLHLNLTGWVSTERDWHQDDYLNPSFVNSWYAAVWVALDTIDADCGPFEYVPGSHRWPLLRQSKVLAHMGEEAARERCPLSGSLVWPKTSEQFVVPAIEAEIAERGAPTRQFLAEKGDVLIWHGRLLHRGSLPKVPGRLRRGVIAHYSGIGHRPDMKVRRQDENGNWYYRTGRPLWRQKDLRSGQSAGARGEQPDAMFQDPTNADQLLDEQALYERLHSQETEIAELQEALARIQRVYEDSTSWRLTAPLRRLAEMLKA